MLVAATAACTHVPSEIQVVPEPTPTPAASSVVPSGVPTAGSADPFQSLPSLRPVDGGDGYLDGKVHPFPDQESFFPVAVWHSSVMDAGQLELDRAVGINTYVQLTPDSDVDLIRRAGMPALTSTASGAASGFVLPDEVDMWARAGDARWSGNYPGEGDICVPSSSTCGFTVLAKTLEQAPKDVTVYANFGKGVTFWEPDESASKFVNSYADIVSADNYWFTDPNICNSAEGGTLLEVPAELSAAECRRAANYGWTVERLRSLVKPAGSKPVWAFVEVGHPFSEEDTPAITIEQVRGAVWSSLIHGARGIVYFNHSFGGDCASQNVLRDCGEKLRGGLAKINSEVSRAAPILNAPFLDNAIVPEGRIDASAKAYAGDVYILAAPTQAGTQAFRIALACSSQDSAQVVGEDRSVRMEDGILEDGFAGGDAVRIYRIAGNGCIPGT